MIEGPDDWAIFTDPAVFGEAVTYTPQGRAPRQITALFTAAHAVANQGPGPGVSSFEPVLTFGPQAFTPAQGEQVTTTQSHPGFPAGTTFRVADPQPDGTGQTRLLLERI